MYVNKYIHIHVDIFFFTVYINILYTWNPHDLAVLIIKGPVFETLNPQKERKNGFQLHMNHTSTSCSHLCL